MKLSVILLISLVISVANLCAQSGEFTYQGKLIVNGAPANGTYNFEFGLWDSLTGGTQVGQTTPVSNVQVVDGVFTVTIDFATGTQFTGPPRYLEIRVLGTGGATLTPRVKVSTVPYAMRSLNAQNAVNASQLGGVAASQYPTSPVGNAGFIQNTTTQQPTSNFNISGIGTASLFSATQYNIGANRVLSILGFNNTFAGVNTGMGILTGSQNSFFGSLAGQATSTGSGNSFFGTQAGQGNTSGGGNSFVGYQAGYWNLTGVRNTFAGGGSGFTNSTGSDNSFFGYFAGNKNEGSNNSFFGHVTGRDNSTGVDNSFFGRFAGVFSTTGNGNSFFGINAGNTNVSGNYNTLIGGETDVVSNNLVNATAIGAFASVSTSNSLVLGGINGVNGATADTNVGIGLTSPSNRLHIRANGGNIVMGSPGCSAGFAGIGFASTLTGCNNYSLLGDGITTVVSRPPGGGIEFREGNNWQVAINTGGTMSLLTLGAAGTTTLCRNASFHISSCSSSLRYKTNIRSFTPGLVLIDRLRPITFDWKNGGMADLGLGAEDVAAIEPLLVTYNDKGQVEGVKYDRIAVVLINAIKEQQLQIEMLKKIVCSIKPQEGICPPKE